LKRAICPIRVSLAPTTAGKFSQVGPFRDRPQTSVLMRKFPIG
jgi:hypothetical protein